VNKAQFIEALAARLDTDRRAAQTYLDAVFDQIYATVSKGEEVVLTGFGKFEKRDRAARTARNPATGAPVRVKKTSVPGFKAGTEFKAIVSGAKKIAKAPAKKVTKAAPAKKTTTAAAKKAAPVKKAVAAKKAAPVKKVAAKKAAPAKKAPAKKAPAKKAVARKTTR
jgi:DNA-binding protein HU-beta